MYFIFILKALKLNYDGNINEYSVVSKFYDNMILILIS